MALGVEARGIGYTDLSLWLRNINCAAVFHGTIPDADALCMCVCVFIAVRG